MSSLAGQVEEAVTTALGRVRPELAGADPLVRRSDRADFQSNVALAAAKRVKARPAELASELAEALHGADGPIADVEVSGPGFLNITTTDAAVWHQLVLRHALQRRLQPPRLRPPRKPRTARPASVRWRGSRASARGRLRSAGVAGGSRKDHFYWQRVGDAQAGHAAR